MTHGRAHHRPWRHAGVRGRSSTASTVRSTCCCTCCGRKQIEISDIPIAQIADQFLRVIHELGPEPGRRLPRDGGPAPAAQGADAAAAPLRGRRLGGPARRAGAAPARVPADQRDGALAGAAGGAPRADQFARGFLPAPPELPPPPLQLDLVDLLEAVRAGHRRHPVAGAAPRGGAPARRRGRHAAASRRCSRERRRFGWREALGARAHDRGRAVHAAGAARTRAPRHCFPCPGRSLCAMVIRRDPSRQLIEAALFSAARPLTVEELADARPRRDAGRRAHRARAAARSSTISASTPSSWSRWRAASRS